MAMLNFWHPVLLSRDLPHDRPANARLAGHSLAIFRDGAGHLGALDDTCPHRRMRLSLGKVQNGRLTCAYHGWTFDCAGQGESPGTPKLHACAESFDCREEHGVIWVKGRGTTIPLPPIENPGFVGVRPVFQRVRAPLALVMDNFSEIEHTGTMHPNFGLDPARMDESVVTYEATEDAVTVRNVGPAKRPPFLTRLLLLFRRRYRFHSDYTFRFDPPRSIVDHWWSDPRGGEAMARYRLHHFFVPEDAETTRVVTFGAARSRWPVPIGGGVRLFSWFIRREIASTIDEDIWLLEHLANQTSTLEGMKLSRFDRALGLNRERLRRIYYGDTTLAEAVGGLSEPDGLAAPAP